MKISDKEKEVLFEPVEYGCVGTQPQVVQGQFLGDSSQAERVSIELELVCTLGQKWKLNFQKL